MKMKLIFMRLKNKASAFTKPFETKVNAASSNALLVSPFIGPVAVALAETMDLGNPLSVTSFVMTVHILLIHINENNNIQ